MRVAAIDREDHRVLSSFMIWTTGNIPRVAVTIRHVILLIDIDFGSAKSDRWVQSMGFSDAQSVIYCPVAGMVYRL